jgi:hypothetical protein
MLSFTFSPIAGRAYTPAYMKLYHATPIPRLESSQYDRLDGLLLSQWVACDQSLLGSQRPSCDAQFCSAYRQYLRPAH